MSKIQIFTKLLLMLLLNKITIIFCSIDDFCKDFVPNWENKPTKKEPILFVNGIGILTYQNVSCIIAAPGVGKSSICESICSAVIGTKGIDTLGLTVSDEITKVLYLDNERTDYDVWNSFERANKRAQTIGKTIKGN